MRLKALLLFASLTVSGHALAQTSCASLPPLDPRKDFIENFLNPCYAIHFASAIGGGGTHAADLNATYNRAFFRNNPKYELIVIGAYPKARYMSITPYDDHLAIVKSMYDAQITPLKAAYQNPFLPGVQYKSGQLYAATVTMGGKEPAPNSVTPGCSIEKYNIHGNIFDGTARHPGLSWNGQPNLPSWYPVHNDFGPSKGGQIDVRLYMNVPDTNLTKPIILARDLTTGCAVLPSKVLAVDGQPQTSDTIVANTIDSGGRWLAALQVDAHTNYAKQVQQKMCTKADPMTQVNFFGDDTYNPAGNPDSGYTAGNIPFWFLDSTKFVRIRARVPQMAKIPCNDCSLTGLEQLRYWGLSFSGSGGATYASVDDSQLVLDPNGYVTIIVGFGVVPPSWVTPANGYTYIDLTSAGVGLKQFSLRTILPQAGFSCSASNIPKLTMEYNPDGGYMGIYVPTIDLLSAGDIPPWATPVTRPHPYSCAVVPPPPQACAVQ